MSKKKPVRAPFTPDQYEAHRKSQAEERQRRGMRTFTRKSVREDVMGLTPAENAAQEYHRKSQVTGRRPAK